MQIYSEVGPIVFNEFYSQEREAEILSIYYNGTYFQVDFHKNSVLCLSYTHTHTYGGGSGLEAGEQIRLKGVLDWRQVGFF